MSSLWVELGLICGGKSRDFCEWKLNEWTAFHWDTSWCTLAQVPYEKHAHIVLLQRSNPYLCPILSATLNPAVCSFYWPISKDISPKTTITLLWLVKSLKWTSVSLDGFNSQKCLQQEVWEIKKKSYEAVTRLQMALRGRFWESHKMASNNASAVRTAAADVEKVSGLTRPSNREQMHLQILHNSETSTRDAVYITNMLWSTAGLLWKYFGCEDRSVDEKWGQSWRRKTEPVVHSPVHFVTLHFLFVTLHLLGNLVNV